MLRQNSSQSSSSQSSCPPSSSTSTTFSPSSNSELMEEPEPALPPDFPECSTRKTRSLRLAFRKFPKDFSSSSSLLSRPVRRTRGIIPFQEPEQSHGPASVVLEADYADELVPKSYEPQIVGHQDMFLPDSTSSERTAASGKRKSESRFYNFLHRSRSRSATRSRAPSPTPPVPANSRYSDLGESASGAMERPTSSVLSSPSSNKTAKAGTKPASRIPSRPLSSTTTATNTTNTTITPRTPTQSRIAKPRSAKPLDPSSLQENARPSRQDTSASSSLPSKTSGARKKLNNLFGLTGTRKLSFSSRPSSPGPSGRAHDPEEPSSSQFSGQSIDYNASQSTASSSQSRSWTTSSNNHSQSTNDGAPKRTGSASKLVMLLRGRSSSRTRTQPTQDPSLSNSSLNTPVVSAPILPKSKSHRRSGLGGSMDSATSRTSANSSSYASPPPPLPTSSRYPPAASSTYPIVTNGVPRIMTTPATPVKTGTSSTRSPPPKLDTIESEGTTWQPMAIVDEEGRLGGLSADSGYAEPPRHKSRSNGKEKEKERRRPASSSGHTNHGHSTRSSGPPKTHLTSRGTKHGSFDFERPGWSGIASGKASTMARSVSGGSTSGGSALTSRTGGSGVNQSRESVANGNGSGTRIPPVRRSTKDSRTNGREKYRNLPDGPLEPDHTGSSAHTTASSAAGLNSSFGRSSGRKVVGGIAKLLGGGVGHGPFPFEPPVPSPTYSAGTNPSPASVEGFARQQQQRPRDGGMVGDAVVEPHAESRTHRVGFGYRGNDRSNPPPRETTSLEGRSNAGHRSATKGRSLDLGLGLSWAPSKVKEEALLPFGRSASVSRRGENGRTQRNVPAAGDSATDLSKAGRDIAEIFRTVLDEDSYAAFRNYVRRFDAKQIPLDGPTGILACVERLLSHTPNLDRAGKDRLLDSFMRIILQNA